MQTRFRIVSISLLCALFAVAGCGDDTGGEGGGGGSDEGGGGADQAAPSSEEDNALEPVAPEAAPAE